MPSEQRSLSGFDKAMKVREWIYHALSTRRGWQRVTLHPDAYRAFLLALEVVPDLLQLSIRAQTDKSGRTSQPPEQSYLAMRVVGTLLEEQLNSFTLEDDPNALSEILKVREKYASDLEAFRATMAEATKDWELVDTDLLSVPAIIESYIQKVRPEFEHTRRALSEWRMPKLILRKGGALIMTAIFGGIGAAVGTAFAGPLGAVSGAIGGVAAPEALKSLFAEFGKEAADKLKSKDVSIEKSLVYLFHAQKALR